MPDCMEEVEAQAQQLALKRLAELTIGAGLNGRNFDATLDDEAKKFFELFRYKWNMYGETKTHRVLLQLREKFSQALMNHQEPALLLALKIFAQCPDGYTMMPATMSYFVLATVCQLQEQHPKLLSKEADNNTRFVAFNFVKLSAQQSLNNAVVRAYGLRQIRELLLPELYKLLDVGHVQEVAQWAISLKLTHKFDMMDLAFPLIATDRLPLAKKYLEDAPEQRVSLLKFLDSLLYRTPSVNQLCKDLLGRYKNLKISPEALNYLPIWKSVRLLVKKFGFDDAVNPNFKFAQTFSHLRYLCREYERGRINLLGFQELVIFYAKDNAIRRKLLRYLVGAHAYSEAIYWFKRFGLKPYDCPPEIRSQVWRNDPIILENREPGISEMYLGMDLPDECLIFVDTAAQFERMVFQLQKQTIIFLDSEWMNKVCEKDQLCILQIATTRCVYLVDCLDQKSLRSDHWGSLGANVFNNVNILKVGFAIDGDLRILQRSLPLQLLPSRYLDLRTLWLQLKKRRFGVELPFGTVKRAGTALTDLSLVCLGKKLDKSNMFSNWVKRPLRREQLLYAAMDARCLMLIYNTLSAYVPSIDAAMEMCIERNNFFKGGANAK